MSTLCISEDIRRELKDFEEYARRQEYTDATTAKYRTYISRFLHQTTFPEIGTRSVAIEAFLEIERINHPETFKDRRAALRLYFKMVTGDSLKKSSEVVPNHVIDALLHRFREYSLGIKNLSEHTVNSEIPIVRVFLEYVFTGSQGLSSEFTATDVRDYVMEHLAAVSDSTKGRRITSIRNFLRCQEFYGEAVHPSIFRLPLSPAVWKKSAFPTTIDESVFDALHTIPDITTDTGKRDRCIILCFTELALRCSEVSNLTLDDFNWRDRYVAVQKTKNGSSRTLPLSAKLWTALTEYLTKVRPQTSCRVLFVRFSHMRGEAMGSSQIRGVVRRNGSKAGLPDCSSGTHILRRTAATKIYNAGNSLKQTADILGHESLDSTTHYAKTDVTRLLTVAAPWPGGKYNVG